MDSIYSINDAMKVNRISRSLLKKAQTATTHSHTIEDYKSTSAVLEMVFKVNNRKSRFTIVKSN